MLAARAATKAVTFPALVAIAASLMLALPSISAARARAADCQPFAKAPCLLPFPSNLFTRADHSTPTGLRVSLPAAAMPVNTKGAADRRRASTTAATASARAARLIVHVPGFDNATRVREDRRGQPRGHGAGVRSSASRSS